MEAGARSSAQRREEGAPVKGGRQRNSDVYQSVEEITGCGREVEDVWEGRAMVGGGLGEWKFGQFGT